MLAHLIYLFVQLAQSAFCLVGNTVHCAGLYREVIDYFLAKKEGEYPHPVMTARVLEWRGSVDEAEALLRGAISGSGDSWNARKELAYLLQRDGRFKEALAEANSLAEPLGELKAMTL